MKKVKVCKGPSCGLSTPEQRNALARRIQSKTKEFSKKAMKGL